MREPIDDPAHLTLRSRNHARTVRQGSQAVWIVAALVGAVLFVLLIRMLLLERTFATIGGSVTSVPTEMNDVGSASVAGSYAAPAASTPDEGAHPSTGMVYRCVGKGGEISLQSEPCGPDARMTKAVHAPPERELPRRMRHASSATANANASSAQYARVSQSNTGQGTRDACAQARRSREETLERVGLARTYDLLQRLDSMVNDACK
jgi:hypothetical protein